MRAREVIFISDIPALMIKKSPRDLSWDVFIPELGQGGQECSARGPAGGQERFQLLEEFHPFQLVVIATATTTSRRLILGYEIRQARFV